MDIILWRHAQAFPLGENENDAERKLTLKGKKQARKMGGWLQKHLPDSCRIWVSPTQRTQETAQALQRKFSLSDQLFTDSDLSQLLELIDYPNNKKSILLIGHEPQLGELASYYLAPFHQDCEIKKGNVWWLSIKKDDDAQDYIYLRAIISPDFI